MREDVQPESAAEEFAPPWSRSERPIPRRVLKPLQSFLHGEVSSGLLLLGAAVAALVWANSPWGWSYVRVWDEWHLGFSIGGLTIDESLKHWVNDGLMTLFFLVVGLEIKRELVNGELKELRAAALPAIAALGGMVVPALLYVSVNGGVDARRGWGIPMATDIAFALGVLTIFGRKLPVGLKAFLLALAIVDDIGAVAVIGIFYSSGISFTALGVAVGLLVLTAILRRAQLRVGPLYLVLGIGTWLAVFESGIHATIAGVAIGLVTPAVPRQRVTAVREEARRLTEITLRSPGGADDLAGEWVRFNEATREVSSPLARIITLLHPYTSYAIVPLFALANAGVRLSGDSAREAATSSVSIGIVLGLLAGKTIGITVFSWVAVRIGAARLPRDVRWNEVAAVAIVAGIGFTVSLFITGLAFETAVNETAAKVGVLGASVLAGGIGAAALTASARARERRPAVPISET